MSITSFTAIFISSHGFSNLSPVSFSKWALNLSFVIVVPPVPLCPLLHSFLRAAYIAPVFPTLLALLVPTTSVPTLADYFSVCSLLLPAFLLPAKLLPLIPKLLLFFSLLLCSFSIFSLLSPAASGWFHSLFSWTMTLCCSLPSRILPLPHLLVYLLSGPSWLHYLSSYPFRCVSPGRHVL